MRYAFAERRRGSRVECALKLDSEREKCSGPDKINGMLNGDPQRVQGKIGGVTEFGGEGGYVNLDNPAPAGPQRIQVCLMANRCGMIICVGRSGSMSSRHGPRFSGTLHCVRVDDPPA